MIGFLFLVIVIGALLYIVDHYLPLDPLFRNVIRVLGILILLWMALRLLGLVPPIPRAFP